MKFSLNLAQYYSDVDFKNLSHDEIVQRIGLQLGAIEDIEDWSQKYAGIYVAKVVACEPHSDADKLKLCMIDDGGVVEDVSRNDDGHVQVVCGAPNVKEGLTVAWIPPGVIVPSTLDKETFVLEARDIRGKTSNGMIASPKELDMNDDHAGILEISVDDVGEELTRPGTELAKLYGLDDFVIDCENKMFTHRPDCFGNLGIARELAGIFELGYKSPDWYLKDPEFSADSDQLSLDVSNEIYNQVPRFTCVSMDNVEVKPSPLWMQGFLKRVGIKPINNVVDITNYVMHFTGQPLHAFDYDKLAAQGDKELADSSRGTILFGPRMAKKDEKVTLLGNKEVKLGEGDIVISANGQAVALGGIMGGANTEVDENTTRIVIECANFDMYTVRRTSMKYGLFTDAVTRFNKGQSPLQNDRAVWYAMKLLSENANAMQASQFYDNRNWDLSDDNLSRVEVGVSFINDRLGSSLSADEMKKLLENVEFQVQLETRDSGLETLAITVPFWRMDISIGEDIVEEIGRLFGYHKLPVELPPRASRPPSKNDVREFRQQLRDDLVRRGTNEVLTHSFVHGDLLRNIGVDPDKWAYHLRNAISPDLQYYRTSLVPSLLAKVHGNIKADAGDDQNEFAMFEFGKAHIKGHFEEGTELPDQMFRLALVFAADDKTAKKYGSNPSAYYHAKKYLDSVTSGQAEYQPLEDTSYPITAPYQKGRSATVSVNGQVLGVVGEFNHKVRRSLKLPKYCAGFELDIALLAKHLQPPAYKKLSTFPGTSQDITLEVDAKHLWAHIYDFVHSEIAVAAAEDHYDYRVEPLDIFREEDSSKNRISFRIHLAHYQKTLKTTEVSAILDHVSQAAEKTLGAKRT